MSRVRYRIMGNASLVSVVSTSSPTLPFWENFSGVRVDNLRDKGILKEMHAAFAFAVSGHARADNLRQAVIIRRADAEAAFDLFAHGFGPGPDPNNPTFQGKRFRIHPPSAPCGKRW